jgi:hypothetical protein
LGAPTFDIIIVPLNFDAAVLGLSGVAQATHWVAVSVFGLPQFGQKTVTESSWSAPNVTPARMRETRRGLHIDVAQRAGRVRETSGKNPGWEETSPMLDTSCIAA